MLSETFQNNKVVSVTVDTKQFIELLEYKLEALKTAKEQDSSWNYDIERVKKQIEYYKSQII